MSVARKCLSRIRIGFAFLVSSLFLIILPTPASPVEMGPNARMKPPVAAHAPGEVLVKFKKGTPRSDKQLAHAAADVEVLSEIPVIAVQRVKSKRGETADALLAQYARNPHVEYVERNVFFHAQIVPNDPRFPELWGLHNTGQSLGSVDADIDAPEAWDVQTGSASVVVASIDSGVDGTHPDLASNLWTNPGEIAGNGIDDDANGYIDDVRGWDFYNGDNDPFDDHGHGTHTSGTIGAVGNNGVGVAGVAWRVTIMPLKFLDVGGRGSSADAASAIIYAATNGAQISNNSWGGGPFSQTLSDAITYANSRGMLFVASAGNAANDNDAVPDYPCSYSHPNIVCVAATDRNDLMADFSSYGATSVDLGAPGVDVLSTVPSGACGLCDASGYGVLSGTSMAAPHVSGAAALVLSRFPALSAGDVKSALLASVDPIPALAGATVTGGRLNIFGGVPARFTVSGSPSALTVQSGGSGILTVTVRSLGTFSEPVTLSLASPTADFTGVFGIGTLTPPPNGSVSTTLTVSAAAATPRGSYALSITAADSLGRGATGSLQVDVPGPDFSLAVLPATQVVGSGASAEYTVDVRSYVGYSRSVTLSSATADPNLSLSFSPNPVTPPPDGVATVTMTVSTTTTIPPGTYPVSVEGRDGIRTRAGSATLVATDADLVMGGVSGPAGASTGDTVSITDTVHNAGADPVGGFYVGLYLSTDAVVTTSDLRLGSRWVNGLAAGSSSTGQTSVVIPESGTPGSYVLGAIADVTSMAAERNEANNVLVGASWSLGSGDHPRPAQAWAGRYTGAGTGSDVAYKVAVDTSGNVYMTGDSWNGTNYDVVTISYDAAGQVRWTARYDSGIDDRVRDLWTDGAGNIYLTGYRADGITITAAEVVPQWVYPDPRIDYITVKYNALGSQVWAAQFDNGGVEDARSITGDSAGNVYVTGYGWIPGDLNAGGTGTVKYDAAGRQVWVHWAPGIGRDVAVDGNGNVYLAIWGGSTGSDFKTMKLNASGVAQWSRVYAVGGYERPNAIVVDAAQNVYVTGESCNTDTCASPYFNPRVDDTDIATLKYDPAGNLLWAARYDNGKWDEGNDLAVDQAGNVYVTGQSDNELTFPDWDYLTVKYDAGGIQQWASRYHGTERHRAMSLALDGLGNTYVTGWGGNDFATIKYDASGRQVWDVRYDNGSIDAAYDVAVDGGGNVYVTGGSFEATTGTDFATVKYVQSAAFARVLSVSLFGTGIGDVTSNPAGVSCQPVCSGSFPDGTVVTLTATPAAGSAFGGFSGGCVSGATTCTVTLGADTSVTATFTLIPRTLTVTRAGSGSVASTPAGISCGATCSATFNDGTSILLTATPATGSVFGGFSGGCVSGVTACTVTILADTTITATFMAAADAPRLGNISTRSPVQTGNNVLIGGFIIGGTTPKTVLVRARGPSMGGAPFNIPGVLANPTMQLYSGATVIAQNDDWQVTDPLCGSPATACGNATQISATAMDPCQPNPGQTVAPPGCSQEAVLLMTLPPGAYTAIISGVGGGTGVGLVEVFEADTVTTAKLTNISSRARVLTGNDVLIGGVIIAGTTPKTVLLRARGPSMGGAPFNIPGVLANPMVQLYSGATVIAQSDNWQTTDPLCGSPATACGTAAQISATAMDPCQPNPGQTGPPPGCSQEAALLVTLPPGGYTAIISGVSGGTGVGLVEVFEVP